MLRLLKRITTKLVSEIHALAWTLAGAGTVLITLSGDTRTQGIWITLAALAIHLLGVLIKKDSE
jgi:hypothetical protein